MSSMRVSWRPLVMMMRSKRASGFECFANGVNASDAIHGVKVYRRAVALSVTTA